MLIQAFYFLFGLACIAGGVLGYVRAGSKASAIAGGVSGGLLLIAALLGEGPFANWIAFLVALLLLGHFGRSYYATRKPMPALPMIVLSLLCILCVLIRWFVH